MPLRYLTSFDTRKIESEKWDVVVIGSGVAGLYSAVNLDPGYKVCVLSKETMDENNSYLAQGGLLRLSARMICRSIILWIQSKPVQATAMRKQ